MTTKRWIGVILGIVVGSMATSIIIGADSVEDILIGAAIGVLGLVTFLNNMRR